MLLLASCKDFSFTSFIRGDALVTVGDRRLYPEDVEGLFTPGMNPEDSLKLLNSYVDGWVKQQLKIQLAENTFTAEEARITKMVDDYRNSLLIYEFEKQYIQDRLDTTVTREEILAYYNDHRGEFRLAAPQVKAVVVKFPAGFRLEMKMRELAKSNNAERLQDLIDICIKNDLEYKVFDTWTDLGEISALMPRLSENENVRLQSTLSLFEATQGGIRYFLVVTESLKEGSPMPVSLATGTIRTMIVNRRKQELLREMEDSLYRAALLNENLSVHMDTALIKIETEISTETTTE